MQPNLLTRQPTQKESGDHPRNNAAKAQSAARIGAPVACMLGCGTYPSRSTYRVNVRLDPARPPHWICASAMRIPASSIDARARVCAAPQSPESTHHRLPRRQGASAWSSTSTWQPVHCPCDHSTPQADPVAGTQPIYQTSVVGSACCAPSCSDDETAPQVHLATVSAAQTTQSRRVEQSVQPRRWIGPRHQTLARPSSAETHQAEGLSFERNKT